MPILWRNLGFKMNTELDLNAIKARLGSISPRKMQDLRSWSEACYKLLCVDLPKLLEALDNQSKDLTNDDKGH